MLSFWARVEKIIFEHSNWYSVCLLLTHTQRTLIQWWRCRKVHKRQCAAAPSSHINAFHLLRWHCVPCFAGFIRRTSAAMPTTTAWRPTHAQPYGTAFLCHSFGIDRNRLLGIRWRVIDQMQSRLASVGLRSTTHHAVKIWQQKHTFLRTTRKYIKLNLTEGTCVCVCGADARPWSFYLFQYGLAAVHFSSSTQRALFAIPFYFHILFGGVLHARNSQQIEAKEKNKCKSASRRGYGSARVSEFKKLEWLNGCRCRSPVSHSDGILCARENQKWKERERERAGKNTK